MQEKLEKYIFFQVKDRYGIIIISLATSIRPTLSDIFDSQSYLVALKKQIGT